MILRSRGLVQVVAEVGAVALGENLSAPAADGLGVAERSAKPLTAGGIMTMKKGKASPTANGTSKYPDDSGRSQVHDCSVY